MKTNEPQSEEAAAAKKKTLRKVRKTITAILWVLIGLMIVCIGYLTYCNISGRAAFVGGKCVVKIVTESMKPIIPKDTYILAEKITPDEVKLGDVILFRSRDKAIYGKINTHRVIECRADGSFITKGDNNPGEDKLPVSAQDVVGRYVKNIPWLTKAANWFSQPAVFMIFIIIPALLLVAFSIRDLIKKSKEVKMDLLVAEEVRRLQEKEQTACPKPEASGETQSTQENKKELADDVRENELKTTD